MIEERNKEGEKEGRNIGGRAGRVLVLHATDPSLISGNLDGPKPC